MTIRHPKSGPESNPPTPAPVHPVSGRPIFYPQWLDPPVGLVARDGRVLRQSSLQNLARLRPCRCPREKLLIEQLAWQWFVSREPARKWGFRRVGKLLGISGAMVYQLSKKFRANPDLWRRRFAPFPWATFDALRQAREETRIWRQRGWLRNSNSVRRRRKATQHRRATARSRAFPPCRLGARHHWRNDGLCRCGIRRAQSPLPRKRVGSPRRFPPCPLARAHDFRSRGICRCGVVRADFLPPPKRPSRPAPVPVLARDGCFYIGCSVVTRDAQGRWMGRHKHPFDPAHLSHDQLPFWARGLAFEPPPQPPAAGASTHFAPSTEKKPHPVPFARLSRAGPRGRRPRR